MRTLTHSLFSVLSLSIVAACVGDPNIDLDNRNDDEQIEEPAAPTSRLLDYAAIPELFGAPLVTDGTMKFELFQDVLTNTPALAGQTFQMEGQVRASCQVRGCWMEIRDLDDVNSPGITVRFYDYGFFVPLDSRGAEVLIEGQVDFIDLTAAEVAEYEAEGYDFGIKHDDGSARVIEYTATGVYMWR